MINIFPAQKRAASFAICDGLARLRRGLAALAVVTGVGAAMVPVSALADAVTIVRNDMGGSVQVRLKQIAALRSAGARVEIRGQCASACTMFLSLPNACVAQSSRLGFHGPQSQFYGVPLPPDDFEYWSRVMADHYPGAIKAWFMQEARRTTTKLITISGTQAIKMGARACN